MGLTLMLIVITSTNPAVIRFEVHDCREIGTESARWAGIRVWHTAKPHGLRQTRRVWLFQRDDLSSR